MYKSYLLLSVVSGLLLGLSWPTNGFTIFIFIGFVPLLYLEKLTRNKSLLKLFFFSSISFFIWNLITTYWLIHSTLFGMVFAVLLNTFLKALVFTSFGFVSRKINQKLSIIYFITSWIVFEKFHLNWDFSWPWLNLGNVFSEKIYWIQWYEYTGVFGGSLWVLLTNYVIFLFFSNYIKSKKINQNLLIYSLLSVSIPISISFIIYNKEIEVSKKLDFSILQPNIDPYNEKYGRSNFYILNQLGNWINNEIGSDKLIIAPETYFSESPGFLMESFNETEFTDSLRNILNKNNNQILSGIQFYKLYNDKNKRTETSNYLRENMWIDIFNSSFFISKNQDTQIYHKSKLVAGVEQMPYKKFLEPILGNVLLDMGGSVLTRGKQNERTVFSLDNERKIAPIICYESVYGEYVTEYVRKGANILAIITNDGWWSESQGYKQHLSYARIRAIETRRNILRSANTGSSAVINFNGEILKKLDYGKRGFINATAETINKLTFYVKYGDFIFRFSLFFFIIILLFSISKKKIN